MIEARFDLDATKAADSDVAAPKTKIWTEPVVTVLAIERNTGHGASSTNDGGTSGAQSS